MNEAESLQRLLGVPRGRDTYRYFGEPVFIYSLREGINDGYLTPFKVKQIQTTLDTYYYTSDDTVVEGEIEADKLDEEADFNRNIEIRERERKRVEIFMSLRRARHRQRQRNRRAAPARFPGQRDDHPHRSHHIPEAFDRRGRAEPTAIDRPIG